MNACQYVASSDLLPLSLVEPGLHFVVASRSGMSPTPPQLVRVVDAQDGRLVLGADLDESRDMAFLTGDADNLARLIAVVPWRLEVEPSSAFDSSAGRHHPGDVIYDAHNVGFALRQTQGDLYLKLDGGRWWPGADWVAFRQWRIVAGSKGCSAVLFERVSTGSHERA